MATIWQERRPERPDPYLDWEFQNRLRTGDPVRDERWCPVLIRVQEGPADRPTHFLDLFLEAISDGLLDGREIRMQNDEEQHLQDVIDKLRKEQKPSLLDKEDFRLEYFAYMTEDQVYKNGAAVTGGFYTIRLVGPPIPTMSLQKTRFSDARGLREPPEGAVAVGIIDDGIAFAHERFRRPAREGPATSYDTRMEAIWLQDEERTRRDPAGSFEPDRGVAFGRRLIGETINEHFATVEQQTGDIHDVDVYKALNLSGFDESTHNATAFRLAHGTHVMDLACGFDPDDPAQQAKADKFYLLAVQLPPAVTAETSGMNMASYVLQGLRQIMLWATKWRPLPLVINFSYGITAGPKDGTHFLEAEINRLIVQYWRLRNQPMKVILSAGNAFLDRTASTLTLEGKGNTGSIDWMLLPDDSTTSFVEIWFDLPENTPGNQCPITLDLAPPIGPDHTGEMPEAGQGRILVQPGGPAADQILAAPPVAGVYYHVFEREDRQRGRIFLAVNPTKSWEPHVAVAPSGRWRITVSCRSEQRFVLNMYIQRDDTPSGFRRNGRQSYFDHPSAYEFNQETGNYDALGGDCPITHKGTLSAIGNGSTTILVGAAEDSEPSIIVNPAISNLERRSQVKSSSYTSSGPTPTREGPDLSAIADDGRSFPGVLAAGSVSGSVVAMRGTSVAAPQVARHLAYDLANLAPCFEKTDTEEGDSRLGRAVLRPKGIGLRGRRKYGHRSEP
jgi:hypothetical protein